MRHRIMKDQARQVGDRDASQIIPNRRLVESILHRLEVRFDGIIRGDHDHVRIMGCSSYPGVWKHGFDRAQHQRNASVGLFVRLDPHHGETARIEPGAHRLEIFPGEQASDSRDPGVRRFGDNHVVAARHRAQKTLGIVQIGTNPRVIEYSVVEPGED
ncbi:MAG: hypothetical protein O6927_09780 [Gammaproteobacteria bacterium]|nr:hypothetical protein [Gammaproteobacteria bacterium]